MLTVPKASRETPTTPTPKANPDYQPPENNGHWAFNEQMGGSQYVGFIYVIYDEILERAYLGKKLYRGYGKLNKGKESNWKKYTSSSKLLNSVREANGEGFQYICLEQYKTKGTLSYAETWSLCLVEAPTSEIWYNTLIEKVSWPVKEAITERHKERLNLIIERLKNGQGT